MDHRAAGVKAGSSISLGPAVGPCCLKVLDQFARHESFLRKELSGLANTLQKVAGAKGGQLAEASFSAFFLAWNTTWVPVAYRSLKVSLMIIER